MSSSLLMLQSTEYLFNIVSGPLDDCFGPNAKVLTVETHGEEVRGLALCPGKVVRYVFNAQTRSFKSAELLSIKKLKK